MREGIHPDYYQAKVVCNCGNEFVTGSTKEEIHVEICSKCHSFYTGQQKSIQARGRIDKFNKKYGVKADNQIIKQFRSRAAVKVLLLKYLVCRFNVCIEYAFENAL